VKPLLTSRLLGAVVAVAMLGGAAAAHASDATTLADRAGFLVGHALRCGVAEARLKRSATLIGELIGAFALDGDDRSAAQSAFMHRVVSSASAKTSGDPLPSCASVRTQFARFEEHRQVAVATGPRPERRVAAKDRTAEPPARSVATSASGDVQREHAPRVAALLVR
jgi:hypothetical protein